MWNRSSKYDAFKNSIENITMKTQQSIDMSLSHESKSQRQPLKPFSLYIFHPNSIFILKEWIEWRQWPHSSPGEAYSYKKGLAREAPQPPFSFSRFCGCFDKGFTSRTISFFYKVDLR